MEKINKIKKELRNLNLDGYVIPKNDEFFGEYVPNHKDYLKFITNFSGSYGFALILKKKNYLFVDGRYSLQAIKESGKKFNIMTIPNKFPSAVTKNKNLKIGFDPKLHTDQMLHMLFKSSNCKLIPVKYNLVNKIIKFKKRPTNKKFFFLKDKDSGKSHINKINTITKIIKKNKADMQFVTAPENIAWLLNLRGGDSNYSPLPNGYLIVEKNKVILFCELNKIKKKFRKIKNLKILSINNIEIFINKLKNKKILIDSRTCSIHFKNIAQKNNKIIMLEDPIYFLKSIKNKIEIKNTIKTHIFDGVALTKFLFWLKNNFKNKKITEISAQNKLLSFRKRNKKFLSSSFPTISGTGPNGAIIHYKADKKSNRFLKKNDLYLIDSGGQYKFGTTDVTRTVSLGNKNKRIKNIFTRVLKGHIAVADYNINKKTVGSDIDLAAREPLNKIGLDYAHGTGHGVGYYLNVHEGPQGISKGNKIGFKEGMILSNEPGYYENNKFGIRIENLVTVIKKKNTYRFINLTMAPIEKSLIEKKLLQKKEIKWINNYHAAVFLNLGKFMNKSELFDLKKACSNI